jgi:hypothetical protein
MGKRVEWGFEVDEGVTSRKKLDAAFDADKAHLTRRQWKRSR